MKSIVTLAAERNFLGEMAIARPRGYAVTSLGTLGWVTLTICYAFRRFTGFHAVVVPSLALRLRVLPIVFVVLAFLSLRASSETAERSQLLQAYKLSSQGEFAGVIRILEPLVHNEPGGLDDVDRGRAWDNLGTAYEALGDYEAARRSYEAAIELLRTLPAASTTYASSLAHLGSLETYMDQHEAAESLLRKAQEIFAKADDHAGLAAVSANRAVLALGRNDTRSTRTFLADAFREAAGAKDWNDNSRAALYSIQGNLAARDRDFSAAVRDYQQAIDFTIRARGRQCYLAALQYTLQADAYRELGEYSKANSDIKAAFLLLEQTVGQNNTLYAATELAYARLLRATGAKAEAKQKENEAKTLLQAIRRRQCGNCSISAASLR